MKAVILAAGYATRLYPLTKHRAKPLLPIHDRLMIDYVIDQAEALPDMEEIYVVSNSRFAGDFSDWARQRRQNQPHHVPLTVVDDGTKSADDRLGAIGDIHYCIENCQIDDDLLVMAGDNLFTWDLREAWQHFQTHGDDMILAQPLARPEDLARFAIADVDAEGYVRHLEEKPARPRSNLGIYAIYFYRRDTLPLFARYLAEGNNKDAPGYFPAWLYQHKPVRAFFFAGECYDIGTPEAYQDVLTTFSLSTPGGQDKKEN